MASRLLPNPSYKAAGNIQDKEADYGNWQDYEDSRKHVRDTGLVQTARGSLICEKRHKENACKGDNSESHSSRDLSVQVKR
ncbi:MAG: hypothetical protein F9K16_05320 [Thermoanaerobaculia bacterium]|jgi:hypothetical protein|nr:MAG: hypothetical protein F9K16_05320 [Thermoanaerobaculia bacterium]MBZ0102019.1 hypothetical protein [Thermoanaerobaculia bacterium]